jgi:hypothetical protein
MAWLPIAKMAAQSGSMPVIEAAARNRARAPVITSMVVVVVAPTIAALLVALLVAILVHMLIMRVPTGRTAPKEMTTK